MNNEPVVPFGWFWFESEENKSPYTQITGYTYERFSTMKPDGSAKIDEGSLIPLYTHQQITPTILFGASEPVYPTVKELTNEKILEVIKELEHSICFSEGLGFFELKEFAEAILRKASEK